jgi:hypothetical protein
MFWIADSCDSEVDMSVGYGVNSWSSIAGSGNTFFPFSITSRPALGYTQPAMIYVPGGYFPPGKTEIKDNSPQSSAMGKNGGAILSLSRKSSWHSADQLGTRTASPIFTSVLDRYEPKLNFPSS